MEQVYVDNAGEYCLFCQSPEVKAIQENDAPLVIFDKNEVILLLECLECGKRWQDVFVLQRVEEELI